MTAGKSQKTLQRMQQLADAEDRKLCFEGCVNPLQPPAFVSDTQAETASCMSILLRNIMYVCYNRRVMQKTEEKLGKSHINVLELDSLHWIFQRRSQTQMLCAQCIQCNISPAHLALFTFCVMRCDSAKCHIFGGCAPRRGAMTAKFELGRDLCTMHLPRVSSSYVYSFGSYRVNTQTNPQTNRFRWKHPTFFAML